MSRNTILTVVCLLVVVAGVGYYTFFFHKNTDTAISEIPSGASEAELSFISLVGELDPITFDTTILSDPRFTSRQDIRTAIVPETAGRNDPFAPLGR